MGRRHAVRLVMTLALGGCGGGLEVAAPEPLGGATVATTTTSSTTPSTTTTSSTTTTTTTTTTTPPPPPPAPPPATAPAPRTISAASAPRRAPALRPPPGRYHNWGGDQHPIIPAVEIGAIEIPKIDLHHPVFEGIYPSELHWGPGHWPGSARPGRLGNSVFGAHRSSHTRPFLDIDRLVPGDEIIFRMAEGTFIYEVTGHQIVTPKDIWIVEPTPDATLTLFACHPKGSERERYVVRGRLLPST